MKKTSVTKETTIKRNWHYIDLKGQIVGRVATRIAPLLLGKRKPYFTPQLDCGDYVVAVNASELKMSGKKPSDKLYYHYSGYPGGLKETPFDVQMAKDPCFVLRHAVLGMLPKNKLRDPRLVRLKIFPTGEHPYQDKFKKKS